MLKRCSKCGLDKTEPEFSRNVSNSDGLQCWCKPCLAVANRSWAVKHPELRRAQQRAWSARNPEAVAKKSIRNRASSKARKPEYQAWHGMVQRCTAPYSSSYERYGAKGIKVHSDWVGIGGYGRFISHMGPRPTPQHSIDRFPNPRGNYEPGNVRWATQAEQMRNTTVNRWVTLDGRTQCMTDWALEVGIPVQLIQKRVDALGWSERDAIFTPIHRSMITIDGVTKPATDWSNERFGAPTVVTKRLFKGWDPVEAVLVPMGITRNAWRTRRAA